MSGTCSTRPDHSNFTVDVTLEATPATASFSLPWSAVEIIGEAARLVSSAFKRNHSEIPWQQIVSQRNVLAHEYGEINQERIWLVATRRIPELIRQLEPLLPPAPPFQSD